jgi:DNA repair protein RadD
LEAYAQAVVGREAQIISTIAEAQRRYKSVLVFCATTEQARHLSSVIKGSAVVLAETRKDDRAKVVAGFKGGEIKTVFNVGCLTTGFDHPALDCIVLLRPTRSPGLYNQMLGRLTRPAEGKTHGTVIDLTGTCKALGRIESFELYQNDRGLWDLRTEKHPTWNNKVLFRRKV